MNSPVLLCWNRRPISRTEVIPESRLPDMRRNNVPSPNHPRRTSRRGSADSHRNADGQKNPNCLDAIQAAARGKTDHTGLANTTLSPYGPPDHRISQAKEIRLDRPSVKQRVNRPPSTRSLDLPAAHSNGPHSPAGSGAREHQSYTDINVHSCVSAGPAGNILRGQKRSTLTSG